MNPEFKCPEIEGFTIIQDISGKCVGHVDWLSLATQTGRLDLVSVLLTILGIVIAVFSIVGFWSVKSRSEEIAREAAIEEARKVAQEMAQIEARRATNAWLEEWSGSKYEPDELQQMMNELDGKTDQKKDSGNGKK